MNALIHIQGHFILTAGIKSVLLPTAALYLVYRLRLSEDIRSMLDKLFARFNRA
jgi:hypothetical protein